MLKIRLQRIGRKHEAVFRVVLVDSRRAPQSGAFLEVLGSYDPRRNNAVQLKGERIAHWITQGSQVSGTVHNLLVDAKIVTGPKRDVSPKVKPKTKEKTTVQKQKEKNEPATIAENTPPTAVPTENNKTVIPKNVSSAQEAVSNTVPEQPVESAELSVAPQETETSAKEDIPAKNKNGQKTEENEATQKQETKTPKKV